MAIEQSTACGRLYIECTATCHVAINTGIQRVVRNLVRHAVDSAARYGYEAIPVIVKDGIFIPVELDYVLRDKTIERGPPPKNKPKLSLPAKLKREILRIARKFIALLGRIARWMPSSIASAVGHPPENSIAPSAGDVLLFLDAAWNVPIARPAARFKAAGGCVVSVIYDLIPISHPEGYDNKMAREFRKWFFDQAANSDQLIGISNWVAGEVTTALASTTRRPDVTYFHLGADLDLIRPSGSPRPHFRALFSGSDHVHLSVGSIEPRKNHAFVLDAFERHWASGGRSHLAIVGGHGWKNADILTRISTHPEFGKRLHLVRDATDDELHYAYRTASALIFASKVEGFGLPIVESFRNGLPVLCSDIPVFREIADGRARFFDLSSPDALAAELDAFAAEFPTRDDVTRTVHQWIGWAESADWLMKNVISFVEARRQTRTIAGSGTGTAKALAFR